MEMCRSTKFVLAKSPSLRSRRALWTHPSLGSLRPPLVIPAYDKQLQVLREPVPWLDTPT